MGRVWSNRPFSGVARLAALAEHLEGFQLGEAVAGPLPRTVDLAPCALGAEVMVEAGMPAAALVVIHPLLRGMEGELLEGQERSGRGQVAERCV